jgi:hypothetical protein
LIGSGHRRLPALTGGMISVDGEPRRFAKGCAPFAARLPARCGHAATLNRRPVRSKYGERAIGVALNPPSGETPSWHWCRQSRTSWRAPH